MLNSDPSPYIELHLRLSDKLLRRIDGALDDPRELFTTVVRRKSTKTDEEEVYGVERDTIDEKKLCGIVDAVARLKDIQRQALGLTDPRDRLRYDTDRHEASGDAVQEFLRALDGGTDREE